MLHEQVGGIITIVPTKTYKEALQIIDTDNINKKIVEEKIHML